MDEMLTSGSEQLGSHGDDKDVHEDEKKRTGISNGKLLGGLVGGTAALTAAAVGGAHLYNEHIDRPVNEAVQIGQQHAGESSRIAGFNEGGVKFELTPEGNVLITLPKKLIKELDGLGKELDATVKNPDGTSQSVDVENPEYHGLGNYSADVSTVEKGPNGEIVSEQQNPDSWREMTASPQPGGVPATLEIGIDGSKGPHSEYTIVEPPQTPSTPTN